MGVVWKYWFFIVNIINSKMEQSEIVKIAQSCAWNCCY